jgi:tetratricopeptide (TPR) repeat protein
MKKLTVLFLSSLAAVIFLGGRLRAASKTSEDLADLQSEAVGLYQAGRYEAAIPLYRRLSEAQPNNKGALKDLLIALWLGERYQEAADVGERLTELSKNDVDAEFMYARSLLAVGQKEAALAAFKRCRELDPDEQHIQLAAARVEGMLREYDAARTHMQDLKKAHPDYKEVYPELARVQQMTGDYAAAAENWSKAVEFFPDNRPDQFHEAECLYYSGRHDDAMRRMRELAASHPPYSPAIDFLTDVALATGDSATARKLLESNLQTVGPGDEARLRKLIHLDQNEQRWKDVIRAADQWLTLNPLSGAALMFKADALKSLGRLKEAIAIYQQILQMNPAEIDALKSMAQAQDTSGYPGDALKTIEKALALDPTDPYLLITQSYYLYETGDQKNDEEVLKRWIAAHPDPALPVLLYHGVTPYPQDPILAYSVHRTTSTLADHLQTLHEAHYSAVTPEQVNAWLSGTGTLPEHPILITFDDARLDSFRYTDPMLQRYDLKATMFVPWVEVESYNPKFASWRELGFYHDTGRWDIESHGDFAHEYISIDAQGHLGLFLLNKKWLPGPRRLETDEEWADRARQDYENSQLKTDLHLGYKPQVYAFPEGNYGQEGLSNSLDSAALNLQWAKTFFASAYHEDDYGFNPRSRDPMHLTRYEPLPGQTGPSLLRHLTDQAPATLMVRRLLREAAWEGRLRDANHWLEELQKRGVSESCLWAEEARIRYAQGDWDAARVLAEKALREDDSPENRDLLNEINGATRSFWKGQFAYQKDNQSRISRRFRQDLGFWHAAGLDWSLHQIFGTYTEAGYQTVTENGGGLGVARNLGDFNRLSLEATGHAFSAPANNTYTLEGELHTDWPESFSTDLRGGRDLYYYASALDANVISNYVDGLVQWGPPTDWRASARTRLEDLSDDNQRATGILEGGHRIFLPKLWLVARATLDTMEHVSPNYYSPQMLQEYQLGPDYTVQLTKDINFNLVYLPGYGREKTTNGEFVNDIDATFNIALTRSLMLSPAVSLIRQPSYHRNTYSGQLSYRF